MNEKRQEIIDVLKYRPTNPIAESYVGALAAADVYRILKGNYGNSNMKSVEDMVKEAGDDEIEEAHNI